MFTRYPPYQVLICCEHRCAVYGLSQGSNWDVITYHFNVSAGGYAKRRDISAWGVHPVKLQMYIPILLFHPIELSFGHVTHGTQVHNLTSLQRERPSR
jgi:hypothetical protein